MLAFGRGVVELYVALWIFLYHLSLPGSGSSVPDIFSIKGD
jgi:hypothetical protein